MAPLGVSLYTHQGLSYRASVELGVMAEDRGFDSVFVVETVANDAMATVEAIALATRHITIGTGIANVFLRHPALLGAGAVAIDELSEGRMILGLGVSHEHILKAVGITWKNPRAALRETTAWLRKVFAGETVPGTHRAFRPAQHPIPIHLAGLALETATLAGEVADGLMLYVASKERFRQMVERMWRGARQIGRDPREMTVTLLIPTFLSERLNEARQAARAFLGSYLAMPFYDKMFRRSGFAEEAEAFAQALARGDRTGAVASLSDRLLDEVCLVGPASRCQEQLAAFSAAGVQYPILAAQAVNEDYANGVRRILEAFRGH